MLSTLFPHRITSREKIWFFQQFLKLSKIGYGILECLHVMQQAIHHQALHDIIFQLKKQLQSGLSLSESARLHPKLFDALCCQLIFIGEESGQLTSVLNHFIICQQQWQQLKMQLKKAIRYPLFLLFTTFILCWMMFAYLIPEFKLLFAQQLDALPMLTQFIFNFSDLINSHQTEIVSTFILFIVCLICCRKKISNIYQRYSWSIPLIKLFHMQIFEIHFSKHLHLLLQSGLPLLESIQMIKQHSTHPIETSILDKLCYSLNEGLEFSHAIASIPYFSILFKQSLQANPHGNTLIDSLQELSSLLQNQLFEQMTQCKDWFEPLIMLLVGALIGVIVVAIYMPIFKLGAVLS